ncbi:MAG: Dol-P-Glc:Glc(2)Man(9)GlcNAc(2)-PP-Dol alpha-1,2-glucosyltransferase [Planctomycetaceae bacterium]|jgi:hypothetical protein|nr:Dol-P-Glc:Glc(2)Man(9)GlcNAc(2)-PP-Dol alpha-1,2-glucosyltransferase [Planctomycetaceae bacterium]
MTDSDNSFSDNPYAYYEPQDVHRPNMINFSNSAESGEGTEYEPLTPIRLKLKYGMFGVASLEAAADQCEITSNSLSESIVVSRDDAPQRIRFKSYRLIVREETGRKFSFRYKRNAFQELFRARLETWSKQRWHDAAEESYMSVLSLLKKHVIRPVLTNMIVLTILHFLAILSVFAFILLNNNGLPTKDFIFFFVFTFVVYGLPAIATFGLSLALGMRQVWALYVGAVFSLFPTLFFPLGLVGSLNNPQNTSSLIGGISVFFIFWIVAFAVTISFFRAIIRYHRQQKRLEKENKE